ncbi:MAG TPA: alpha-galactosidase [Candidatus Hydrogenedentes bacterium]|nr:alpha-galactosidase [Candidatus Hydrogenedentota bacterium]
MRITMVYRDILIVGLMLFVFSPLAWGGRVLETEAYRIGVRKDAQVDSLIPQKESVFKGAHPLYRTGESSAYVPMFTGKPRVTQTEVTDALGRGTALVLESKGCTWQITAYSGMPFFTVQATYENTGSESLKISALAPWVSANGCTLGEDTNKSVVLDNGTLFNPQTMLKTADVGRMLSLWNLAVYNATNGRSLIAGFLTGTRAYAQININRDKTPHARFFDLFQAECVYDPPVEVLPGETLTSELLYISVAERAPLEGVERFTSSVAVFNDLHPTRHALPHGWDSWVSHYHKDVTETTMLAELDFLDKNLKRYGWTHFSIDDGWQHGAGDWEADPVRFPKGMQAFAEEVHRRGMTAAIWTEPFTVDNATPLAKEQPDWLAAPGMMGKSLLGENERILDVTAPGAAEYVKNTFHKITQEWGYDGLVETDFVYHLLAADALKDPKVTRAEALRKGMEAIRAGAGKDTFIMGVAPFPITGIVADGMRTGIDCGPIWRSVPGKWCWGCVDTLTNAARRYYFAPRVFALDQDCVFFGHDATRKRWKVEDQPRLTRNQQIAWVTGAALTGGAIKVGDALTLLTPDEVDILRRLLPVLPQPARPVDLFERKEARIWVLPVDCAIGKWHIAGVFNWNENAEETIPLSFSKMGLQTGVEYAVFDFWPGQYCGRAKDTMDVTVPPASVRLLSFRPVETRPMFLATDSHFTQGATDFDMLDWNSETRMLSGRFRGIVDTNYKFWILTPDGFMPKETQVSTGDVKTVLEGEILRLEFHCDATGPATWHVQF